MSLMRGSGRVAADYGFLGAVIGFVLSVIVFAIMFALSLRIDRSDNANAKMGCACLLRLVALLVLTVGMGLGYIIGRSMIAR